MERRMSCYKSRKDKQPHCLGLETLKLDFHKGQRRKSKNSGLRKEDYGKNTLEIIVV